MNIHYLLNISMQLLIYLVTSNVLVARGSPAHKWRVETARKDDQNMNKNKFSHHSDLNKAGQCYCGVPNAVTPVAELDAKIVFSNRIVGGNNTLLGEYPWQVSLLEQGLLSNHICGGTIVSSLHVVTAAHCTAGKTAESLAVAVGFTNLSSTAQDRFTVQVKEIRDHPNYKGEETNYEDDISVLVLSEELDLALYPHIKPVCLPSDKGTRPAEGWYVGEKAVVSGWGLTDFYFGTYPQHLQDVEVEVYGKKNCGGLSPYIRNSQFCAGHDEGGKDACQGDSGGPLVVEDAENNKAMTLVGVVSAGSSCADKNYPGLYTDVKKYCTDGWLQEQIAGARLCSHPPSQHSTVTTESTTTTPIITTEADKENIEKAEAEDLAVILIGGDGYSFGKKVEVWSPTSSCNKQLPDLPDYRTSHSSAGLDGVPVVCGGERTLKSCLKMNSDQYWETFTPPKEYRSSHLMISYGPGLLIIGGSWSSTVEYFVQGSATLLEGNTPRLDSSCAALTDRDSIIVTGGKGGKTNRAQAWEFSLKTGYWDRLPDIPYGGRYQHACTFFSQGERRGLLISGGSSGTQIQASTLFFDINKGQWLKLGDMNTRRWGPQMVNLGGRIFVIGGGDGRNYVKDVEEFDVQTFSWKKADNGVLFPRSDFSVVTVPASSVGCENDGGLGDVIDPRK